MRVVKATHAKYVFSACKTTQRHPIGRKVMAPTALPLGVSLAQCEAHLAACIQSKAARGGPSECGGHVHDGVGSCRHRHPTSKRSTR